MAATAPFGDDMAAARRFAAGFLERCIRDAFLDSTRRSSVIEWLNGHDCVFPFSLVCTILGVDENRLRRQIERQLQNPSRELMSTLFAVPQSIVERNHTATAQASVRAARNSSVSAQTRASARSGDSANVPPGVNNRS